MRKKLKKNKNVISQSISTSIQTKKEYSLPQKNISIFNNNNNRNKIFFISTLLNQNISSSKIISTKITTSNSPFLSNNLSAAVSPAGPAPIIITFFIFNHLIF